MATRRGLAWLALITGVLVTERLCANQTPLIRMLALIAIALVAVKALVCVEERVALSPGQWLAFLAWPGMRPALFARPAAGPLPHAGAFIARGAIRVAAGIALLAMGRALWTIAHSKLLATAALLAGLSFILHFGLCNLLAGFWRWRGVACEALFRAPWRSTSLTEFWGRRWNLAFSQMTAVIVYRPLQKRLGQAPALAASFLLSGLLHEMAISLPVRAGYGLPTLYFALQGGLVLLESRLAGQGWRPSGWTGRVWAAFWLIAPLPLLFHRPFLAAIVWPLAGIPQNS